MLKPSVVKSILKSAANFDWELWKTGMLRLDLDDETVLHIWDKRYQDPKVTMVHDHPFDLKSTIVAGRLINFRYVPVPKGVNPSQLFWKSKIRCGANACEISNPTEIYLQIKSEEFYSPGETYRQLSEEIHRTMVELSQGAVTLVNKIPTRGGDRDHAHVYIMNDEQWGDAAPRPATLTEIVDISLRALELFDD